MTEEEKTTYMYLRNNRVFLYILMYPRVNVESRKPRHRRLPNNRQGAYSQWTSAPSGSAHDEVEIRPKSVELNMGLC